jgi:signal peptidase
MRHVIRFLSVLLLTVALAAVVTGAWFWHEGYRAYAVRTGSMSPAYPIGSLLLDAPIRSSAPRRGEVITFETPGGPVTHRVYDPSSNRIVTKGDANRTPDVWTVQPRHVIGHVIATIPNAGYALVFLKQPGGVPSLVLLVLSVWLAWSLFFPGTPEAPGELQVSAEVPLVRSPAAA